MKKRLVIYSNFVGILVMFHCRFLLARPFGPQVKYNCPFRSVVYKLKHLTDLSTTACIMFKDQPTCGLVTHANTLLLFGSHRTRAVALCIESQISLFLSLFVCKWYAASNAK